MRLSLLPAALAAALLALAPEARAAEPPARNEISVTGSGEVAAVPDVAGTSFTVTKEAKTPREALDEANRVMTAMVAGMKALGVEARDLRTSSFNVAPQYRYDTAKDGRQMPPKLVGYRVSSSLAVTVRDIAKLGEVLDRGFALGATSGGEIGFTLDDPAALRVEARRRAMADATASAKALAEAAGVPLGRAIRIDLADERTVAPATYAFYDQTYNAMMADRANLASVQRPPVPVEAGEQTVRASVSVVFAIGG